MSSESGVVSFASPVVSNLEFGKALESRRLAKLKAAPVSQLSDDDVHARIALLRVEGARQREILRKLKDENSQLQEASRKQKDEENRRVAFAEEEDAMMKAKELYRRFFPG